MARKNPGAFPTNNTVERTTQINLLRHLSTFLSTGKIACLLEEELLEQVIYCTDTVLVKIYQHLHLAKGKLATVKTVMGKPPLQNKTQPLD